MVRSYFKIFAEDELSNYLTENNREIKRYIEVEDENYILNVNEVEYINFLVDKFSVDIPIIDFDNKSVNTGEKEVYTGVSPYTLMPEGHSQDVVIYYIPITGNEDLFRYMPNPQVRKTIEVFMEDHSICFEIEKRTAEWVSTVAEGNIKFLKKQYENFESHLSYYNDNLRNFIEKTFNRRKKEILDTKELLSELNVPIKKTEGLPETFSIPTPEIRKTVYTKPKVMEEGFKPEPTLDESIYKDILNTIAKLGINLERLPAVYHDKEEEELRDHFLFYLEPMYKGSATGETFNKSGKTDILIRYKNSNVFIAECKIWRGKKSYLEAITQLLRYLTWRDSKAAIILFVKNKEFSSVLDNVKNITPTPSN